MIEFIEIKKNKIKQNNKKTYDLEVETDHSYNIEGIIVHNSNCTTRKETAVGRPQLSAVIDCAEAAHAVNGMICADGGITCNGDICKAYGAGADFVMVGSLVAGTDEADGEILQKVYKSNEVEPLICNDGYNDELSVLDVEDLSNVVSFTEVDPIFEVKKFKLAYGMSSKFAQDKHWNGMNNYRTSEGIVTLKPYVGAVQGVIDKYLGGLRSCMTYISARRLKDIPKCTTFYRANRILNNDGKGIL